MNQKTVYVDVENTLQVAFVSGIQRVTRRLLQALDQHPGDSLRFVPVVHSPGSGWRRLTPTEKRRLYRPFKPPARGGSLATAAQRARNLHYRTRRRLEAALNRDALVLPRFEAGSIFLDIDSAWHNEYRRRDLLPALKVDGVSLAALHYDIIPELMPERVHPRTRSLFGEYLESQLAHVELFVCISRSSQRDLLRYAERRLPGHGISTETIVLGSDIGDDANAAPPDAALPARYLLYVGTIEPRKNLDMVVDALERLRGASPDLGLVIAGRYGWNAERTVHRIREAARSGCGVQWLNEVGDPQLAYLYRNAFLTVVPSWYEGCGLPVLEALRCGSPVLSSSAGALPEAGGDCVDYFDPDHLDGLVALIRRYLEEPAAYERRRADVAAFRPSSWGRTAGQLAGALERHFG